MLLSNWWFFKQRLTLQISFLRCATRYSWSIEKQIIHLLETRIMAISNTRQDDDLVHCTVHVRHMWIIWQQTTFINTKADCAVTIWQFVVSPPNNIGQYMNNIDDAKLFLILSNNDIR